MKVIITTLGSDGDIFPFIGIGKELQQRGHEIIFLTSDYYKDMIPKYGFTFRPIDSYSSAEEMFTSIDPSKMAEQLPKHLDYFITAPMEKTYEIIEQEYEQDNTVLINWKLMAGAKIASEKFNIPLVSIYLSPSQIRSVIDPPRFTFSKIMKILPKSIIKKGYAQMDTWMDSLIKDTIDSFRKKIGLSSIKTSTMDWLETPDRLIAVFPEWFAKQQKDWPGNATNTTFPLFVEQKESTIQNKLDSFLSKNDKPILVTPGSQIAKAHEFFQVMNDLCNKLNLRGIFRTKYKEQLPANIGKNILHIEYADFNITLPKVSLIIHHGGIGTVAQAIKAGIPQIIIPWGLDQYDNAQRIKKIGIGDYVDPKKINAKDIAKKVKRLITSKKLNEKCSQLAKDLNKESSFTETCDIIEKIHKGNKE